MHISKATKRIAKKANNGFQGYPQITLAYFGETQHLATKVVVSFIAEEGAPVQFETFASVEDVRQNETIQTTILKIIERANAKTVLEIPGTEKEEI